MDTAKTIPPSQGYIVVDSAKCSGCQICMLICSLVHEGKCNTQLARIQVIQNTYKPWPDCIQIKQCRQCLSPACVDACPTGAAFIDTANGNVRVIDESKCDGCQLCLEACPYEPAGIVWNFEKLVAIKCDLCANAPFLGEPGGPGGKQACVDACPQEAIKFTTEIPSQVADSGYEVNLR
jgi:protein NrfC